MKNLPLILASGLLLSACAQSGSSGSSTTSPASVPIEGTDYSGTYKASEIQCFDSTSGVLTAVASLGPAENTSVLTIQGNSYNEMDTTSSCSLNIKGRIVFSDKAQFTVSQRTITTGNGSSCAVSFSLTSSMGPPLNRSSIGFTMNNGESLNDVTNDFFGTTKTGIWISSLGLVPQGRSSDFCFMKFLKQ